MFLPGLAELSLAEQPVVAHSLAPWGRQSPLDFATTAMRFGTGCSPAVPVSAGQVPLGTCSRPVAASSAAARPLEHKAPAVLVLQAWVVLSLAPAIREPHADQARLAGPVANDSSLRLACRERSTCRPGCSGPHLPS